MYLSNYKSNECRRCDPQDTTSDSCYSHWEHRGWEWAHCLPKVKNWKASDLGLEKDNQLPSTKKITCTICWETQWTLGSLLFCFILGQERPSRTDHMLPNREKVFKIVSRKIYIVGEKKLYKDFKPFLHQNYLSILFCTNSLKLLHINHKFFVTVPLQQFSPQIPPSNHHHHHFHHHHHSHLQNKLYLKDRYFSRNDKYFNISFFPLLLH